MGRTIGPAQRGFCRQGSAKCARVVKQALGPGHAAFLCNDLLACLAEASRYAGGHRLRSAGCENGAHPGLKCKGVDRRPPFSQVLSIKVANSFTQPCPEFLDRIQVRRGCWYCPQRNSLRSHGALAGGRVHECLIVTQYLPGAIYLRWIKRFDGLCQLATPDHAAPRSCCQLARLVERDHVEAALRQPAPQWYCTALRNLRRVRVVPSKQLRAGFPTLAPHAAVILRAIICSVCGIARGNGEDDAVHGKGELLPKAGTTKSNNSLGEPEPLLLTVFAVLPLLRFWKPVIPLLSQHLADG